MQADISTNRKRAWAERERESRALPKISRQLPLPERALSLSFQPGFRLSMEETGDGPAGGRAVDAGAEEDDRRRPHRQRSGEQAAAAAGPSRPVSIILTKPGPTNT